MICSELELAVGFGVDIAGLSWEYDLNYFAAVVDCSQIVLITTNYSFGAVCV